MKLHPITALEDNQSFNKINNILKTMKALVANKIKTKIKKNQTKTKLLMAQLKL